MNDQKEWLRCRDEIVRAYLPATLSAALGFRRTGLPVEELVGVGAEVLIHAMQDFDPDIGKVMFSSYIANLIKWRLIKYYYEQGHGDIYVSPKMGKKSGDLDRFIVQPLEHKLMRGATISEIASRAGVSREIVDELLHLPTTYAPEPLEVIYQDDASTDVEQEEELEAGFIRSLLQEAHQRELLYFAIFYRLPDTQRNAILLRYGLGGREESMRSWPAVGKMMGGLTGNAARLVVLRGINKLQGIFEDARERKRLLDECEKMKGLADDTNNK